MFTRTNTVTVILAVVLAALLQIQADLGDSMRNVSTSHPDTFRPNRDPTKLLIHSCSIGQFFHFNIEGTITKIKLFSNQLCSNNSTLTIRVFLLMPREDGRYQFVSELVNANTSEWINSDMVLEYNNTPTEVKPNFTVGMETKCIAKGMPCCGIVGLDTLDLANGIYTTAQGNLTNCTTAVWPMTFIITTASKSSKLEETQNSSKSSYNHTSILEVSTDAGMEYKNILFLVGLIVSVTLNCLFVLLVCICVIGKCCKKVKRLKEAHDLQNDKQRAVVQATNIVAIYEELPFDNINETLPMNCDSPTLPIDKGHPPKEAGANKDTSNGKAVLDEEEPVAQNIYSTLQPISPEEREGSLGLDVATVTVHVQSNGGPLDEEMKETAYFTLEEHIVDSESSCEES